MVEPPNKKESNICDVSSIDYSSLPYYEENSFLTNVDLAIPTSTRLPADFDGSVRLTFNIPRTPQYIDFVNTGLYMNIKVVPTKIATTATETPETSAEEIPATPAPPTQHEVAPICGILYTGIKSVEIWNRGKLVKQYNDYGNIVHPVFLLNYSNDYLDKVLAGSALFAKDVANVSKFF